MDSAYQDEKLVEQRVTYTLLKNEKFYIVENVPARVNQATGEQFFSPETVKHLQQLILRGGPPRRVIETPVFDFV